MTDAQQLDAALAEFRSWNEDRTELSDLEASGVTVRSEEWYASDDAAAAGYRRLAALIADLIGEKL